MIKRIIITIMCFALIASVVVGLTGCGVFIQMAFDNQEYNYYLNDKDGFISVTAVITEYRDVTSKHGEKRIMLDFDDDVPGFCVDVFKIEDANRRVVRKNGFEKLVKPGTEITFISNPYYFGNGYIFPVVGLSVGDVVLLDFEEGYENLLESYR